METSKEIMSPSALRIWSSSGQQSAAMNDPIGGATDTSVSAASAAVAEEMFATPDQGKKRLVAAKSSLDVAAEAARSVQPSRAKSEDQQVRFSEETTEGGTPPNPVTARPCGSKRTSGSKPRL